jgi:hypothetical protein
MPIRQIFNGGVVNMPGKVYADLCPKVGQWFDGGDSF